MMNAASSCRPGSWLSWLSLVSSFFSELSVDSWSVFAAVTTVKLICKCVGHCQLNPPEFAFCKSFYICLYLLFNSAIIATPQTLPRPLLSGTVFVCTAFAKILLFTVLNLSIDMQDTVVRLFLFKFRTALNDCNKTTKIYRVASYCNFQDLMIMIVLLFYMFLFRDSAEWRMNDPIVEGLEWPCIMSYDFPENIELGIANRDVPMENGPSNTFSIGCGS